MQEVKPGEHATVTVSDAKQIIADAIWLRVVMVSVDQSKYAAEDVLAQSESPRDSNFGRQ
jgi:hypothetical protein